MVAEKWERMLTDQLGHVMLPKLALLKGGRLHRSTRFADIDCTLYHD